MNIIVHIAEALSAFLTILTLYLVVRSYKWWLFYAVNCILFAGVNAYKHLLWYAIMGIFLCCIGIKNYRAGRLKEKEEEK